MSKRVQATLLAAALLAIVGVAPAGAGGGRGGGNGSSRAEEVARYWTAARRAAAIPRDLVLDERGRGYLRLPDGSFQPYGGAPQPRDTLPPSVTNRSPADDSVFNTNSVTFSATVTDADGVKSVTFNVGPAGGSRTAYSGTRSGGDVWSTTVSGLADGAYEWTITVRDNVKRKGGNVDTTSAWGFTVSTGTSEPDPEPDPGTTVTDAQWTGRGAVQTAIGRIYFEMPTNTAKTRWGGYVCSGTVANDGNVTPDGIGGTNTRSVVITAAHCVYDDATKTFARNVMFIPNQAEGGAKTDRDCTNDPLGCWHASHGAVDNDWANRTWPSNIPWDYAYYVVKDDAHAGAGAAGDLDGIAGALDVQFSPPPTLSAYTHALGYSYDKDPQLRYCAEGLAKESTYQDWWLGSCALSGGSSGGPWIQPMTSGSGPIVSVNSWGYRDSPGMAGPELHTTTRSNASCVFNAAKSSSGNVITNC